MKKILSSILFLLLIGFYFFTNSCNRTDFTNEIAQVDSLSAQIDDFRTRLNQIDSTLIMDYSLLVNEDLDWAADSLSRDNMPFASVFLAKVRIAKKFTNSFPAEYSTLKKELTYSHVQLIDLKNDMLNNSIEKVQASKYINDEKMAVVILKDHMDKMTDRLTALKDYPEVRKDFYDKVKLEMDQLDQ
jgi:hypothetical protein